jgi:hypothetical protein
MSAFLGCGYAMYITRLHGNAAAAAAATDRDDKINLIF